MRQWKVALSIAVVAAAAAPFVAQTYKDRPQISGFEPLTAEKKTEISAYLTTLNDCQEFETIPMNKLPREADTCFQSI